MVKVSVLMPIKHPALWLDESLKSLEQQTFDDWNLVAIIHGIDDVAEQLLKSCAFPVLLLHAPASYFLSEVLNLGLNACAGDYIARFDSDDVASPDRLISQVNYLDTHPDIALVGSDAFEINGLGEIVGYRSVPHHPREIYNRLKWRNASISPSVMFRRTPIVELGGYNKSCAFAEDYELWLRLQTRWDLASLERPLIQYRVHKHQTSRYPITDKITMHTFKAARVALALKNHESALAARARYFLWATWLRLRRFYI